MKQAINIPIKSSKLNGIYKSYTGVRPHITLVYPFEYPNQRRLKEHIKKSISKIKPFKISFDGLRKSKKKYSLYILVKKGKKEIIKLMKKLNSGLLEFPKKIKFEVCINEIQLVGLNRDKIIKRTKFNLK